MDRLSRYLKFAEMDGPICLEIAKLQIVDSENWKAQS